MLTETVQNIHSNMKKLRPRLTDSRHRESAQIQNSMRQQQIANCFMIWHTGRESYRHLLKVLSLLCHSFPIVIYTLKQHIVQIRYVTLLAYYLESIAFLMLATDIFESGLYTVTSSRNRE